jgi:[acyl-carrier-protein] S-malonyltransferase
MAAIMGLAPEEIEAVCGEVAEDEVLEPANFNTPTQTVVSGDEAAVERLVRLLDRRRMTRAARLAAGAAFHSSLMAPVRGDFAALTAEIEWRDPVIPVASNASGTLVRSASAVRSSLLAQLTSPVRWVQCVHALLDEGCEHFLELGPGTILRSLVRQISRKIDVVAVDSRASIEDYIAARPYLVER